MYQWILAFHIIFVISWFAGLFYMPRLFVYHAGTHDDVSNQRFKLMERKLHNVIMLPAAILTTITGAWLLSLSWMAFSHAAWLYVKLFFVLLLYGYQYHCWKFMKDFRADKNRHTGKFYRYFNEAPTIALVVIVIMVVVKPF
tara:strand:+ start:20886 stop:21311 length:426 start_codon:yes stop_codon:yes gene_type:complete